MRKKRMEDSWNKAHFFRRATMKSSFKSMSHQVPARPLFLHILRLKGTFWRRPHSSHEKQEKNKLEQKKLMSNIYQKPSLIKMNRNWVEWLSKSKQRAVSKRPLVMSVKWADNRHCSGWQVFCTLSLQRVQWTDGFMQIRNYREHCWMEECGFASKKSSTPLI